jgi:HlyD family secretion protein
MPSTKWMNQWRIWAAVFLGTALVVTAYALFSKRRDAVPTVQIIQPTRTTLVDEIKTNGKIEPIDPQIARSQLDAFVAGAFAKEGRPVRRGQTILALDANQIRADLAMTRNQLLAAQEGLRKARAGGPPDEKAQLSGDLRQAQVEVDRLQRRQEALEKLLATHASTQDEVSQNASYLERARAALDVILKRQRDLADRATLEEQSDSLRVQEVEARIHLLQNRLQSATVTSTIDGTLYSFSLRVGDLARVGDVLAEIADLRKVRLRAFVDETDLGELKLGQPVKITWDAMPERAWTGKTEQIPQQVLARGTRSIGEVLCSVDNDKLELLPNVNVDVRILVQEKNNALVIPRATVRTEQGKHFVLVLNGDRLRRREVVLGMANSTSYEIVSGLEESDQVALSSNLDIKAGTVVRISETK